MLVGIREITNVTAGRLVIETVHFCHDYLPNVGQISSLTDIAQWPSYVDAFFAGGSFSLPTE